jgi:hypothetical protein
MSSIRRGRVLAAFLAAVVLLGGVAYAALFIGGRAGVGPLATGGPDSNPNLPKGPPPLPPRCPLTGVDPEGEVPNRPALAIKVENLPSARPQTGLSWADIVYEEPVEAGITRFIAVYQCQDAERVQPVRSARLTDPDILVQFGRPLFAYSGGVAQVTQAVRQARLIDVNASTAIGANAYQRDPQRQRPHDLYTSTRELYRAARSRIRTAGPPEPVFAYRSGRPTGRRVQEIHLPFSSSSDVSWRWSPDQRAFVRFHGSDPHVSSDGTQFSARNVVVQVVKIVLSDIVDVNGVRSPEVVATGSGEAYVLRRGRIVTGTWSRPRLGDVTRFHDANGEEILLTPGNTWVELLPDDVPVTFS